MLGDNCVALVQAHTAMDDENSRLVLIFTSFLIDLIGIKPILYFYIKYLDKLKLLLITGY